MGITLSLLIQTLNQKVKTKQNNESLGLLMEIYSTPFMRGVALAGGFSVAFINYGLLVVTMKWLHVDLQGAVIGLAAITAAMGIAGYILQTVTTRALLGEKNSTKACYEMFYGEKFTIINYAKLLLKMGLGVGIGGYVLGIGTMYLMWGAAPSMATVAVNLIPLPVFAGIMIHSMQAK